MVPERPRSLTDEIAEMVRVRAELKRELKLRAKSLKKKQRKLRKLKAKVRELSEADLRECLEIRIPRN